MKLSVLLVTSCCSPLLFSSTTVVAQDTTGCKLPFIYKTVSYTSCITIDDPNGALWCSTLTDNQNNHIQGNWKHCTTRRLENQGCSTYPDERNGECVNIQECPVLNSILQQHTGGTGSGNELEVLRKSVCANDRSKLRVCCPRISNNPITSPPANPINRADLLPKKCGISFNTDRIVNGDDSKLAAWPWMVIFRARSIGSSCRDNDSSCSGWASTGECKKNPAFMLANCKRSCNNCPAGPSNWICGGVLITDQYVLSAAHCFKTTTQIEYARIGEHDLSKDPDREDGLEAPHPQDIKVEHVIKHPGHGSPCLRCNDIALIKLERPAILHQFFVQPICLPSNPELDMGFSVAEFQNKLGTTTGWGVTDAADIFSTTGSDKLQQVKLKIQELPFCSKQKNNYPDGRMILCAGQGDGKDACRADSGGPLMLSDSNLQRWYVVGITSFGATVCGDRSAQSVFTSIHHYIDWIKQNVS